MKTLPEFVKTARKCSVPFLAVTSADQLATQAAFLKMEVVAKYPAFQWNIMTGIKPANDSAATKKAVKDLGDKLADTAGFANAMDAAAQLPEASVLFVHNANRYLHSQEPASSAANVQALSNLREPYRTSVRMVVLLGPVFQAPLGLAGDIVVFDEPLPGEAELQAIIAEVVAAAELPALTPADMRRATDAVSGLSAFGAEQVVALSIGDHGIDWPALWDRKRVAIEQTPGLRVHTGPERFSDIVGADAFKEALLDAKDGRTGVGVVVWVDEIDKVFANVEGDTTGVRTDQTKVFLGEMENNEYQGAVGVGVPGAGKSLIAKAFGNEAGVLTIELDLAGLQSKFVGESEGNMRYAMAVIKAIGRGRAYFIATSNAMSAMRPELQRRFTDGFWFFDLMTEAERAAAWAFYLAKYEIPEQERPADDGWTGAEIRNCCRKVWNSKNQKTLVQAAKFILPMAQSRADEIERLRQFANGRFLDITSGGTYVYDAKPMARAVRAIARGSELVN